MNGSRSGIPRERKNRSQANEMLWIVTFGFDLVRLRNVLVFLVWRIRQVSPLSSKTAWPLIVTRFCSDRTVMGANRPAFAASGELRWILTTPESAKLAISSRSTPIACRKELLAKMNRSASNLPMALGNPNASTAWHAAMPSEQR
jgi:hypothetical protein